MQSSKIAPTDNSPTPNINDNNSPPPSPPSSSPRLNPRAPLTVSQTNLDDGNGTRIIPLKSRKMSNVEMKHIMGLKVQGGSSPKGKAGQMASRAMQALNATKQLTASIKPTSDSVEYNDHDTVPDYMHPFSSFRNAWDVFIFGVVSYNCFYTPLQIMILFQEIGDMECYSSSSFWLDLLIDLLFWADTSLNFFFAYRDPETKMIVSNRKAIRGNFIRSSSFTINVIASSQPFFTVLTCELSPTVMSRSLLIFFQLPRMMRIFLFMPQFNTLKAYMKERKKIKVNESMFRMGVILFFILLGITSLGCMYYSMGFVGDDERKACLEPSWVVGDGLLFPTQEYCDVVLSSNETTRCEGGEEVCGTMKPQGRFLRAIYFMMQTLFTIGYGDSVIPVSDQEMLFASIFMILGTFVYGLVIANMTSMLANIDVLRMRFRQEMDSMNAYMDMRHVPDGLKQRVKIYFDYLYMKQYGLLEETILASLPSKVRHDIASKNMQLFMVVPFFTDRGDDFSRYISQQLILRTYAPGSTLIFQHEKQRELIIIRHGQIEIVTHGMEQSIFSLRQGDFIGDYQLIFGVEHKFGARADVFVEVVVLTVTGLQKVLKNPNFHSLASLATHGHYRGCKTDEGVKKTEEVYKEKIAKYSKLHENMNKTSTKMQAMMASIVDEHAGIMMPDHKFHIYWDLILVFSTLYLAIMIPIRIDSEYNKPPNMFAYSLILDYLIDVIFLIDIVLNSRYFAYTDITHGRETVVTDKTLIQANYTKSLRFKLDAFASFPIDLIGFGVGNWRYLRLMHGVRFFQVQEFLGEWCKHLEEVQDYVVSAGVRASLQMTIWTAVLATWTCVAWDIIYFKNNEDWQAGGILENESSFWPSVYWTFTTFTTVGYGDISPTTIPQTIFALIIGALGAAFCAAIIANVTSFVHSVDVSEDNVEHKRKVVQAYLVDQGISKDLQTKLDTYFKFVEQDRHGIEEQNFLNATLPGNLRDDMMLHITSDMVLNCEFFSDCDSGFIRGVMLSLEQQFFALNQFVLDKHTPANGMYFVKSGVIEIQTLDGVFNNRLTINKSFAEDALINHWEANPFLAVSTGDSEVWFFSRAMFNDLVFEWPGVRKKLHKLSTKAQISKRRNSLTASAAELKPIIAAVNASRAKVFRPGSIPLQLWKTLVLIAMTYNLLMVPFRISFNYDHGRYYDDKSSDVAVPIVFDEINVQHVLPDYIGDLILIVDVLIQMFLLAFYKNNVLIYKKRHIFRHYRRRAKWGTHLIAAIPFEILLLTVDASSWRMSVYQVFSIFRLSKLFRAREIFEIVEYLERMALKRGVANFLGMSKNARRVAKLMVFTFFCAHYFGCVFFIIALRKHLIDRTGSWADNACLLVNANAIDDSCENTSCDTFTQYVNSIYWATATLTTVGYGDISASIQNMGEIYFNILALIFGTLIYTFIIANLEDIVAQLDVTQTLFKKQLDSVKMYINMQNLDENIGGTILTYFDYLWIHQGGQNGNVVLDYMPKLLAEEVREEIVGHLVGEVFFVKDAHRDFVALFTNELLMTKYLPGDVLFYSGEIASALFFLYRGKVKLISHTTGVEYTTVTNSVVGEGEFFMKSLTPCTAIAVDHAETFILTWDRFWRLVNEERALGEFKARLTNDGGMEYLQKNSISSLIERVKKNLAKSKKMQKMTENISEEETFKYWVCEVDSIFRRVWDLFGLIFCVYYSGHLPFKMAFVGKIGVGDLVVDILAELYFVVDVYFRLQHFAVRYEGTNVRDRTVFRGLYMNKGGFALDLVSVLPVFFIKYAAGGEDNGWVWMYSFNHFLRFRCFGLYLKNLIDSIEYFFAYRTSTGAIRIGETFVIIATITHWTACFFFFLGRMYVEDNQESWLSLASLTSAEELGLDGDELRIKQYVTAIYWSLYTISTTGYGNISLTQNGEKIFAMIVMIIGAIICDAGITAVLTALIENKDHQAGTNYRRLDCAKKYMTQAMEGNEEEQNAVVEFFTYEDTELNNIDARAVLSKLSAPLRQSIIVAHCEDILIASEAIGGFSRGVICSLIRLITTEVAIPEEVIIERGVKDDAFYILHSGRAKSVDDAGGKGTVQPGGIISNVEAEKRREKMGLPAYSLRAVVYNAKNLPKTDLFGACDPYVEISYGKFGKVRTTVKKITRHPVWHEIFYVKMTSDVSEIVVNLYDWNRVEEDELVGGFTVPIADMKEEEDREYELVGPDGKTGIGSVVMSLHHGRLARHQKVKSSALTITAETFCHLYKLENKHIEEYTLYLDNLDKPPLQRLPNLDVMENAVEEFKRKQSSMLEKSMRNLKLGVPKVEEERSGGGDGGEGGEGGVGGQESGIKLDEDGLEIIRMKTEEFSTSTRSFLDNVASEQQYDVAGPDSNLEGTGMFKKKRKEEGARDTIFKPRRTSIRRTGAGGKSHGKFGGKGGGGAGEGGEEGEGNRRRSRFSFGFMRGSPGGKKRESAYID